MNITFKVSIAGASRGLKTESIATDLAAAVIAWEYALEGILPDKNVNIEFSFGSRPAGTVASTITSGSNPVRIVFDNNKETKFHNRKAGFFSRLGKLCFYTVALHEIGHALGLPHNTRIGSIMETHAPYSRWKGGLSADDARRARTLLLEKAARA